MDPPQFILPSKYYIVHGKHGLSIFQERNTKLDMAKINTPKGNSILWTGDRYSAKSFYFGADILNHEPSSQ